jgi:amino acid transporter/mannitol/fructose-specific phosphotransferase system IIA component (Ntr-type)
MSVQSKKKLKKDLGLVDIYAISTGAMFSSGFFLLPGLAFALSGAWVVAAYLISAALVVPAMLSKAELASAMPKAGGTYYFLDRSMGPLVGTIGGLGTWVAMGLKNTFALIGMGAYLALVLDVDITMVALCLTVVFTLFNIVGAKETAGLQRILVFALVSILGFLVAAGIYDIFTADAIQNTKERFSSAAGSDASGVFATVGLVFVSYAGLTKAVSVAEEVRNPDRNLIRGMALSLLTAVVIYVVGSYVLVMLVDHEHLATDLTPIATVAETIFDWAPAKVGLIAILVAAVAAFASTANAGIMAASRYLLAMGRDKLIPDQFASVGRFRTPTFGVLASAGFIAVAVVTLDVITVAKLASAFQLLMFAMVNLAVIVMRESRLQAYDPVYKAPLYPWLQIFGIFSSFALIIEMGQMPLLFTLALVGVCVVWFFAYAKNRVVRRGAILHWFERLGRQRFDQLETELREIMRDKGLRPSDPYEDIVERAPILDLEAGTDFDSVLEAASEQLAIRLPMSLDEVSVELVASTHAGETLVDQGVAIPHFRTRGIEHPVLVVARVAGGADVPLRQMASGDQPSREASAFFILVSPDEDPRQHLRLLAKLASVVINHDEFLQRWEVAGNIDELRALLRTGESV